MRNYKMMTIRLTLPEYNALVEHASAKSLKPGTYIKRVLAASYSQNTDNEIALNVSPEKRKRALNRFIEIQELISNSKCNVSRQILEEINIRMVDLWDTLR